MNLPYLNMPPIWDAAAGVFAPAIYLYENNFNLSSLLQCTGYLDAGPNVHSLSILTLLTYGVIELTDGQTSVYLLILHLVQFAFAAMVLTLTFNIAQRMVGNLFAAFVALTLFLLPVFLVQTGYLYTEVIGSAMFLFGINAWAYRRFWQMIIFAILACTLKSFGLVLVFILTALLLVDNSLLTRQRIGWIALVLLTAVTIEASKWGLKAPSLITHDGFFGIRSVLDHLKQVPDLLVLVLLSAAFPLVYLIRCRVLTPQKLVDEMARLSAAGSETRIWLGISIFPSVFVLFLATVPLTGHIFLPLPRYYVWVLPFMVLILAKALISLHSQLLPSHSKIQISPQTFGILLLATVAILSGLNRNGKFYPPGRSLTSFSIAERSFEYLDFYKIQREGVQAMAKKGEGRPLVVTRGEYYFLSSPLMGYVDQQVQNIHFILAPPYKSGKLTDFPQDFLILDSSSNSYHGKHLINSVVMQALNNPHYLVKELARYQRGRYHSRLMHISLLPE